MGSQVLSISRVFWAINVLVLVSGCGGTPDGDRPQVVPVSGTVLYNEKPVEGAMVVFIPEGQQPGAAGLTDASGKFRMRTFQPDDGAVPGEYKITVRKTETSSSGNAEGADDFEDPRANVEERWLLPKKYSSVSSSGLTANVKEGEKNDFQLDLRD